MNRQMTSAKAMLVASAALTLFGASTSAYGQTCSCNTLPSGANANCSSAGPCFTANNSDSGYGGISAQTTGATAILGLDLGAGTGVAASSDTGYAITANNSSNTYPVVDVEKNAGSGEGVFVALRRKQGWSITRRDAEAWAA